MSIVKDMFLAEALGGGGGGGGSSYELLGSKEFEVSTTSTSETSVGSFTVEGSYTSDAIIYVKVRDKAGKRNGYYLGSDCFALTVGPVNGATTSPTICKLTTGVLNTEKFYLASSTAGVYLSAISTAGEVTIKAKYSSSFGTIDGTYVVEVYALPWPKNDSPFKEATA